MRCANVAKKEGGEPLTLSGSKRSELHDDVVLVNISSVDLALKISSFLGIFGSGLSFLIFLIEVILDLKLLSSICSQAQSELFRTR